MKKFFKLLSKPVYIILLLIFAFTLVTYLYNLTNVPYGFHEDEAHIGYNAYSLLHTLRDKNNVFLPLAIDQFGDYRPSGLHFLTVPSVAIFGLTVFATRFPCALVGALSIIAFFFLCLEVFQSEVIALIGAAFLAITPWQIIASRSTSEGIVAQFFVIIGMYFMYKYFRLKKRNLLIFSTISFFLSYLFYHAARFFVPVILVYFLGYIWFNKKDYGKLLKPFLISFAFLVVSLALILKFSNGADRPLNISIFNSPATMIEIRKEVSYSIGHAPEVFGRVFHNALVNYPLDIINNYLQHFDSDFLYFKGGLPPRYMVSGSGNFYLIEGLFFLIGLSLIITSFVKDWKKFFSPLSSVVVWLLIGPLPAALTYEDIPHFERSISMLPAFVMLSAFGLYSFLAFIKNKKIKNLIITIVVLITVFNASMFLYSYFIEGFRFQPIYRNEGEKELVAAVDSYTKAGDKVIMTSQQANRLIFFLFYNKVDPKYYQSIGSPRDYDGLEFQNLVFVNAPCPTNDPKALSHATDHFKTIFVNQFDCQIGTNYKTLQLIHRPDDEVVFQIDKFAY